MNLEVKFYIGNIQALLVKTAWIILLSSVIGISDWDYYFSVEGLYK